MIAHVTKPAPDFSLEGVIGNDFKTFKLSDYQKSKGKSAKGGSAGKGKWVVLFFYPLDFTFVCPTEITAFSKALPQFKKLNAEVLGVSTDSVHSHKAWLKELGDLGYPLLSDITHQTAEDYGTLIHEKGISLRGTFIIDPEGILRYALYHDLNVGRSVDECLRVLSALQTGELCPIEWKPGQKTLGKS